ncbi:conserved hypothetical protein [Ricinus communis]|uniref:Uncharacterized protein n=1 Tax=Ricinus communis TaxID=3988 RepID=B9SSA5_RICCO|nr:conserved hypothetical protein [Ricinus communis]
MKPAGKENSLTREESEFANRVKERFENQEKAVYKTFINEWKLYGEGYKSKHDLYCDIALLFGDYQDFLMELAAFLKDGYRTNVSAV